MESGYRGPLSSSDADLMAGVRRKLFGRPQTLAEWLDTMAWDADSTPSSFDDVSYGLQRLVHAGLIKVWRDGQGRLLLAPTAAGAALLSRARPSSYYRGEVADRIADEFARTVLYSGDTTLGRFPDLDESEWERERRRFEHVLGLRMRPILALAGLLRRYLRWRHPEDYPDESERAG
jgi:hypothetical protein